MFVFGFTTFWIDIQIAFVLTLPVILFVSFPFTCFAPKRHRMSEKSKFLIDMFLSLLVVNIGIVFAGGFGKFGSLLLQNSFCSTILAKPTDLFCWCDTTREGLILIWY